MPPKHHTCPVSGFTPAAKACLSEVAATNHTHLGKFLRGDRTQSSAHHIPHRLVQGFNNLVLEILDNAITLPLNGETISMTVQKLGALAPGFKGTLPSASSGEKLTAIRRLVKRSPLTAYPTLA